MRRYIQKTLLVIVGAVTLVFGYGGVRVSADTCPKGMALDDCQAIIGNWVDWKIPTACTPSSSGGTGSGSTGYDSATPTGADPPEQIYNFLVGKGLSPAATAGIMGNIQEESHFDPANEQMPGAWQDMSSLDVKHGGKGGVGLVQWDGGRRPAYINYARNNGADPKNIVPQLNYIWHELNGGYKESTLVRLQAETDPGQAAYIFHKYYEISSDTPAQIKERMDDAVNLLAKYANKPASGSIAAGCNGGASLSPQCATAAGNARILCAAQRYDTVSYFEGYKGGHQGAAQWHKECPVVGPSCYLDCSGLVNIAVYDVYHTDLDENTEGERAHVGTNWKVISLSEVQAGDIVQPVSSHVEIIDHVQGNKLYTFGAHTDLFEQKDQVGASSYPIDSGFVFYRYIGPGA